MENRGFDASTQKSLFQERFGDTVTFYSDGYDSTDKKSGAFFDIVTSMRSAKKKICITGWTLSPAQLFTYAESDGLIVEISLPKLFVECASKGVKVNAIIWRNLTPDFYTDTDTFNIVVEKQAKIKAKEICELDLDKNVKAEKKKILSNIVIKFSDTQLGYSDHAKMVIVDSMNLYLGGLDLTKGRTDIKTWHDCHCRIQKNMNVLQEYDASSSGSVVDDAQELFDARFKLQLTDKEKIKRDVRVMMYTNVSIGSPIPQLFELYHVKMLKKSHTIVEDHLKSKYQQQHSEEKQKSQPQNHQAKERIRLLTAVRKENFDPKGKIRPGFDWEKNTHTRELLTSQIDAIRKARYFIYMESQFFIGPHKDKTTGKTIEGPNLVIIALLNKIKEKIRNGEKFHFYCQLPYRPEGGRDEFLVHTLLRKQWNTMQWFISEINETVKYYNEKNDSSKPKSVSDYITFTNLGCHNENKSAEHGYEMKYTHSKLMIVDDDIAFIGSNNCNERSNKGNRDHEVCLRIQGYPAIKKYRQTLMAQQLGVTTDAIIDVETKIGGIQSSDFVKLMHEKLDDNLAHLYLSKNQQPRGTPWGNVPRVDLVKGIRPPHVPKQTPKIVAVSQASSDWAYKITK